MTCIDASRLFTCAVEPGSRSDMNVVFRTGSDELDAKFVQESVAAGFTNLKGHRTVGGMRASIYNAMPIEGVEKLCDFIKALTKTSSGHSIRTTERSAYPGALQSGARLTPRTGILASGQNLAAGRIPSVRGSKIRGSHGRRVVSSGHLIKTMKGRGLYVSHQDTE